MANEVKIEQEQFEQLTNLFENLEGYTDQMASYLASINEKIDDLTNAVKAVESAVENLPQG